jgi:hypothetical protein
MSYKPQEEKNLDEKIKLVDTYLRISQICFLQKEIHQNTHKNISECARLICEQYNIDYIMLQSDQCFNDAYKAKQEQYIKEHHQL